ncbi:glycosyltransferase [Helicobacter himalayensis]|uniref:glycosyltransferase n=1 Tax=Helicobacter himalayensis TaxID=1591088 RepID=UPI003D6DD6F8
MKTLYLDKEFDRIFEKLYKKENFTLARFGDGERAIMVGDNVKAQEGWEVKDNKDFANALLGSLNIVDDRFIYTISCPCCDEVATYWYQTRIKSKNLSFSNIFVNFNYRRFKEHFDKLSEDAVLIANYRAKGKKIGNLNILKHYEISDDCNAFFKEDLQKLLSEIKKDFGKRENLLFVVSAGPLSEIIICDLFLHNPNNRYIDFGSSIDFYFKSGQAGTAGAEALRPYMIPGNEYAERNCIMPIYENELDVSVVLNLYKRPQALKEQLRAIQNQSLRPKEILLYQDGVFEGIEIPKEIEKEFDVIEISKENKGVWERFRFAQRRASSELVCVFDDDTIPGRDFLANCFSHMQKQEGLYGTTGVVLQKPENYPYEDFFMLGWRNPNKWCAEVDFVGHSWFFKKQWLESFFAHTQSLQKYKAAAEDMGFSLALQKIGIKTFVPAQPYGKFHLWGEMPESSLKFGSNEVALFMDSQNHKRYNDAMKECLELGFKILKDSDKNAYKNARKLYIKAQFRKEGAGYVFKSIERAIRHKIKRLLGIKKYQKKTK